MHHATALRISDIITGHDASKGKVQCAPTRQISFIIDVPVQEGLHGAITQYSLIQGSP